MSYKEPYDFEAILRIFMGVLIEEFISTIAGLGNLGQIKNLVVFYETGVLMRTLGCSGGLLRVATVEMTKYLQDISVGKVSYFSGNEEEALGILRTIVERKQAGGEVFRETAEAMANAEIDIPRLKAIEGMLTQRLAELRIFAFEENYDLQTARYQIDENRSSIKRSQGPRQ